jgi:hypothetical protein
VPPESPAGSLSIAPPRSPTTGSELVRRATAG